MTATYIKTEAICLHPEKYGKQTLLFTKEKGPVKAFRIKDRLGQMDICSVLDILLESNEYFYLKECTHKEIHNNPDYNALIIISYFTEILSIIPADSISDWKGLYEVFYNLIHTSMEKSLYFNLLLFFQLKLLIYSGLAGDSEECISCGNPLDQSEKVYVGRSEFVFYCNKDRIKQSEEITKHEYKVLSFWSQGEKVGESLLGKNSIKRIQTIFISIFTYCMNLSNQEKFLKDFYRIVDE